jgi:hypothetical protein
MRFVMKQFEAYKRSFSSTSPPNKIDLPESIGKINIPGKVKDGELTITKYDLQTRYYKCNPANILQHRDEIIL